MRNSRATIVGIVGGLVLLAALAGVAIGLPKITGQLPHLPNKLDDRFVAISAATPEELGATSAQELPQVAQFVARAKQRDDENTDHLSDLYGEATVRSYLDVSALKQQSTGQLPPQVGVTVVKSAPGLVIPSGPFQVDQDGQHYALKQVDGYQCASTYADPQPATPTTAATSTQYLQTECRTDKGEYTYDVFGSNISPDDVAALLKSLVK
ncbi:hypothetical protein [Nocardioides montaniterrae]